MVATVATHLPMVATAVATAAASDFGLIPHCDSLALVS